MRAVRFVVPVVTGLLVAGLLAPTVDARTEDRVSRVAGPDRIATSVAVSRKVFPSARRAVLARADDFADALAGTPLARRLRGPLLLTWPDRIDDAVLRELDRLSVDEVVVLGAISDRVIGSLPRRIEVRRVGNPSRVGTAAAVGLEFGAADVVYLATADRFPDALAVGPLAAHTGRPVLLTWTDRLPGSTASVIDQLGVKKVYVVGGPGAVNDRVVRALRDDGRAVERIAGRSRYGTAAKLFDRAKNAGLDPRQVWLATGSNYPDALSAGAAVAASGGNLLLVPGNDLRRAPEPVAIMRNYPPGSVRLVGGPGAITRDASWQVHVMRHAPDLPRGRLTLFPEFRMVAFYGNAESPAMGVLGEQPPDAAYDRLWRQAEPYRAGGRPLLPTFELIVSVATKRPGPDGDYSRPTDPRLIEKWLAAARRHDTYLLLDIQPGRSDFLSEVRRYERFLREPDVGIALDPEWRMHGSQVPGETVGTVDAAEVNRVVDYTARLTREARLPQKLFVVHQFRTDMVTNRHRIKRPSELAVVFHMDGHGSRSQKLETYRHVHVDPRTGARNGFKLFYDEDRDMFSPPELLRDVRPVPDLVTYQ